MKLLKEIGKGKSKQREDPKDLTKGSSERGEKEGEGELDKNLEGRRTGENDRCHIETEKD